jgi:hypothetical protein
MTLSAVSARNPDCVRETPDWKLHTAELETEMLGRGMMFEVIDWSEGQTPPPFEE